MELLNDVLYYILGRLGKGALTQAKTHLTGSLGIGYPTGKHLGKSIGVSLG
jgi:hypothetical protein